MIAFARSIPALQTMHANGPEHACVPPRALSIALLVLLALAVATPGAGAQGHAPEPGYQDDRSTPEAVISSYYDAVDRREYARAYSYWEPLAAENELPPFDQFAQGYADTVSVDLTLGGVGTGVGAGQLYYSVPVTLVASMADGSTQTFVGCYLLHLARPQLQAVPPFHPLAIERATISQVDNDADTTSLMAQACPSI
jgi:hypothetical protein